MTVAQHAEPVISSPKRRLRGTSTPASTASKPKRCKIKESGAVAPSPNLTLEDMKFVSLDLRRQLRCLEKRISQQEEEYILNSHHLDGQPCNLLNGFCNHICLKAQSPTSPPADNEARARRFHGKRISIMRAFLHGTNMNVAGLNEFSEQSLFSLTSTSSPLALQLALPPATAQPKPDLDQKQ